MRRGKIEITIIALIVVVCPLVLAACSTSTTSIKLKDPSQVAVSVKRVGRTTLRPIERGTADTTANLGDATISRSSQTVTLDCPKCAQRTVTLLDGTGLTAAAPIGVSELIEERKTQKNALKLDYRFDVAGSQTLYPVLESKWSNAEYFQENYEPVRALGWLIAPGSFLIVGGVLALFSSPGAGIGMIVPGVALDVWGAWQLMMNPSSEQVGLDGTPIRTVTTAAAPKESEGEKAAPAASKSEESEPVEKAAPASSEDIKGSFKEKREEPKKAEAESSAAKPDKAEKESKTEPKAKSSQAAEEKADRAAEEKPAKAEKKKAADSEEKETKGKDKSPKKQKEEKLEDFLL
jgi:hypothetical protein